MQCPGCLSIVSRSVEKSEDTVEQICGKRLLLGRKMSHDLNFLCFWHTCARRVWNGMSCMWDVLGVNNDCTREISLDILLSTPLMCSATKHTFEVCWYSAYTRSIFWPWVDIVLILFHHAFADVLLPCASSTGVRGYFVGFSSYLVLNTRKARKSAIIRVHLYGLCLSSLFCILL